MARMSDRLRLGAATLALIVGIAASHPASADAADPPPAAASQAWAVHAQATVMDQGTLAFSSSYRGPNSLDPAARGRETADITLYAGVRPWAGAEIWINPEIDQGFGLSNTLGIAGFPSGEAYKVGHNFPYLVTHRLFLRQTFNLGGDTAKVDPDQNVLGGAQTANRVVLTLGKVSVGDIFDTNAYAHDPRGDFSNWALIDAGTFDYAADAWGYTYGAAAEWYQGDWTLRGGGFAMSRIPNGQSLDSSFRRFQLIGEAERRFVLGGRAGSLKITGFLSRAPMGAYSDAIRAGLAAGAAPSVGAVTRYQGHGGVSLNLQQPLTDDIGLFARAGLADGHQQAYEFTDIDRTISAGVSVAGARWARPADTAGAAVVVNDISNPFKAYLNAGGLGVLVGDGRLPHPGAEAILETYYSHAVSKAVKLALDYQYVANPAYNRDRGPVSIVGLRLHAGI